MLFRYIYLFIYAVYELNSNSRIENEKKHCCFSILDTPLGCQLNVSILNFSNNKSQFKADKGRRRRRSMQQSESSTSSPTRGLAKRKMPESFYKPPLLKTQICSLEQHTTTTVPPHARSHSHSSHHAHTFSLPVVDAQLNSASQQVLSGGGGGGGATMAHTGSTGHLYEHSYASSHLHAAPPPPVSSQTSSFVGHAFQHAKTFSLPVSFNPYMVGGSGGGGGGHAVLPSNIDIPLPPGWQAEKTASGQTYFINHLSKTTTWEDPRQLYNLPSNQNEIGLELRAKISETIALPAGWEEARNANGDVYYIDHNKRTTCWEDPRLSEPLFACLTRELVNLYLSERWLISSFQQKKRHFLVIKK